VNERLLIIDDEPNIRTMMKLALEHSGYSVDDAPDGEKGLIKFGDGSFYSLVLLDQRLPGLSGLDVLKEIFNRDKDARVIIVTAFGTIDFALEALQAGASDFLRKPFTAETLRTAVRSVLDRPFQHHTAVPVGMVCKEFTRTTINGYAFTLEDFHMDERLGDIVSTYRVTRGDDSDVLVKVFLPAYVQELIKATTDTEHVPGGDRFWQALCEESLANHLWHNASVPTGNELRIEDVNPSLGTWIDSMLTVQPPR